MCPETRKLCPFLTYQFLHGFFPGLWGSSLGNLLERALTWKRLRCGGGSLVEEEKEVVVSLILKCEARERQFLKSGKRMSSL
jgi:hypothetical protein